MAKQTRKKATTAKKPKKAKKAANGTTKTKAAAAPKKAIQKKLPIAQFTEGSLILPLSDATRTLFDQSAYGSITDTHLTLSLLEGLYLLEKGRITIKQGRRKVTPSDFLEKAKLAEPQFWTRYCVYKDMRNRGYIIKTALKFGADFRVYDRGVKPGQDHARWVIYPVQEGSVLTWYEFSAKNRVAHSTKKRLMVGAVDDEGDVTYWEIRWMRP